MNNKLSFVLYTLAVFFVFMLLTWFLRQVGGKLPIENGILGIFKGTDFILGGAIALILVRQKRSLKK